MLVLATRLTKVLLKTMIGVCAGSLIFSVFVFFDPSSLDGANPLSVFDKPVQFFFAWAIGAQFALFPACAGSILLFLFVMTEKRITLSKPRLLCQGIIWGGFVGVATFFLFLYRVGLLRYVKEHFYYILLAVFISSLVGYWISWEITRSLKGETT